MSAILLLEAIVVLLGIPVAENTGGGTGPVGVGLICGLAAAHVLTCAVVRRRYAVGVILALQVLLIGCWAINGALGVMGIVFGLVWLAVLWMRREFRRRLAAGLLPSGPGPGQGPAHGLAQEIDPDPSSGPTRTSE